MTRPERALVWTLVYGPTLSMLVAIALLISGRSHVLGLALLFVALVGFAVPVRPVVVATVRRRLAREGRDEHY
jgi:predicted MFS family arabinose efflux permease